jgi:ABC-type taurine transport system substrate-binding protein
MKFRYPLPDELVAQASSFAEFANGGAQCHVALASGEVFSGVLVSGGKAIAAMRGQTELPFSVGAVERLFQTAEDIAPTKRGEWHFFDEWSK